MSSRTNLYILLAATGLVATLAIVNQMTRRKKPRKSKSKKGSKVEVKRGRTFQRAKTFQMALNGTELDDSLTPTQVRNLYATFREIADENRMLNQEGFGKVFHSLGITDRDVIHAAFSAFDLDHSGTIDFGEFAYTLAVMTQGTPSEKLEILFKCYDIDGDGFISREDLIKVYRSSMEDKPDNEIESLVNEAIRELDAHHTGMISQRDFMQLALRPNSSISLELNPELLHSFGADALNE